MANRFFNSLLGSSVSLPFDNLSMTDAGVWGLQKLRTDYTGYAVRAALAADAGATTLDIGFLSDGSFDMATYEAFGTGTEKITRIYDQSGNGFNFLQSTLASCGIVRESPYNALPCIYTVNPQTYAIAGFTNWQNKYHVNLIAVKRAVTAVNYHTTFYDNGANALIFQEIFDTTENDRGFLQLGGTRDSTYLRVPSLAGTVIRFKYDGYGATDALTGRLFRNGTEITASSTSPAGHVQPFYTWTGLNAFTAGDAGCEQEFFCKAYLGHDIDADFAALNTSLQTRYFTFTDYQIQFAGDSLTYSATWTDNAKWAYPLTLQLETLTGTQWDTLTSGNIATEVGATIERAADLSEATGSLYDKLDVNRRESVVVVWAGTNNIITGDSAATMLTKASTFVDEIIARGATKVFYLNCIARKTSGAPLQGVIDSTIASFNSGLAAELGATATVIDVAAQTELSDYDDATYYNGDGIHLTQAGYDVVKDTAYAAIVSALNL